jgi:hypothetical protein
MNRAELRPCLEHERSLAEVLGQLERSLARANWITAANGRSRRCRKQGASASCRSSDGGWAALRSKYPANR